MKLFWLGVLFIFASGCAGSIRPPQVYHYKEGSVIGIVDLLPKTLKHHHIGTTIFNNFEKDVSVSWDFPADITDELKAQCVALGYHAVIIDKSGPLFQSSAPLTLIEGDKLVINPVLISELQDLVREKGLSLLYVIQPGTGSVHVPNIDVKVSGYGLVTRNFLVLGGATAFSKIDITAISLQPLDVTQGGRININDAISGFKMIGNFGELSEDDIQKVKQSLYGRMKKSVSTLLLTLYLSKDH